MKKLLPYILFLFVGFSVTSCSNDDDNQYVDYDTYSFAYDLNNVNFAFVDGFYQYARSFNRPLYDSDVVLIFRKTGITSNGSPIWQSIPSTYYLAGNHEVDYSFDFSKFDFVIYAGGTFDLATAPEYIFGQTFRVVVVPAQFGRNSQVDFNDYESVIKHFNIDESKINSL